MGDTANQVIEYPKTCIWLCMPRITFEWYFIITLLVPAAGHVTPVTKNLVNSETSKVQNELTDSDIKTNPHEFFRNCNIFSKYI